MHGQVDILLHFGAALVVVCSRDLLLEQCIVLGQKLLVVGIEPLGQLDLKILAQLVALLLHSLQVAGQVFFELLGEGLGQGGAGVLVQLLQTFHVLVGVIGQPLLRDFQDLLPILLAGHLRAEPVKSSRDQDGHGGDEQEQEQPEPAGAGDGGGQRRRFALHRLDFLCQYHVVVGLRAS